jgi:hypothetical protein
MRSVVIFFCYLISVGSVKSQSILLIASAFDVHFRLCLWFGYNYEVLDSDLLKVITGR